MLVAVLVLVATTSMLLADTGWYITQENNERGFTIPAYMTEDQVVILLDGTKIDLINGLLIMVKHDEKKQLEIITGDADWRILMVRSRIYHEALLHYLLTSADNEIKMDTRGLGKVNLILAQEMFHSSFGGHGVKLAIVPNEQKRGESQVIEEKTKTGSITTTTVSDKEATVLVK